ncbi:hypothetical protein K438DRAFT_1753457 [Mycena galopus ATCC 62051]|nr:hypothetical protein K438DRAFT_1753457 [Mycena galopus ATCC 62051]
MFLAVTPTVSLATPRNPCSDGQYFFICCWPPDSMNGLCVYWFIFLHYHFGDPPGKSILALMDGLDGTEHDADRFQLRTACQEDTQVHGFKLLLLLCCLCLVFPHSSLLPGSALGFHSYDLILFEESKDRSFVPSLARRTPSSLLHMILRMIITPTYKPKASDAQPPPFAIFSHIFRDPTALNDQRHRLVLTASEDQYDDQASDAVKSWLVLWFKTFKPCT